MRDDASTASAMLFGVPAREPSSVEIIEPPRGPSFPNLRELASFGDLLTMLTRRDISVRYRQTAIGAGWAIAQPVIFAAVFGAVMTLFGRLPTGGVPYPIFALTGLTLWFAVSAGFAAVSNSTVASKNLIERVYFPRLILPLSALGVAVVDFFMALGVLLLAMLIFGVGINFGILLAPLFLVLGLVVAFGAGLWLAALGARYRDTQFLIPVISQVFLFLSPVLYPLERVPESVQPLYALNPMVGILEGFRWAVLPSAGAPAALLLIPVVSGIVLTAGGLLAYGRAERSFADLI